MTILTDNGNGIIHTAQSNDGTIKYCPIANDRLVIDGRDAWRGLYLDSRGIVTDERVDASQWDAACALMHEVDAHNTATLDAMRLQAATQQDARDAEMAQRMSGVRGGYNDPNTF